MQQTFSVFEQHAVPQNISSYQFRLVGDMTIKQFFQLAGGALISLLIYASPLPSFLQWPFIIFFVLLGAALAFLPLEDRPLEQWLVAFFRSVYSPTIFRWSKTPLAPIYFQEEIAKPPTEARPSPSDAMTQTLMASGATFLSGLEETEKNLLTKFTGLFSQSTKPSVATVAIDQPSLEPTIVQIQKPTVPPTPKPDILPFGIPPVIQEPSLKFTPPKKEVVIPHTQVVQTGQKGFQPQPTDGKPRESVVSEVAQTLVAKTTQAVGKAQFSPDAAPPMPPTQPNVVVGQVMDKDRKIIEGAILEIKDPLERPVRALKSNKVGHFLIVTPLTIGKYRLTVEKEGYEFEPIEFEAKGAVIPPMAIRAK